MGQPRNHPPAPRDRVPARARLAMLVASLCAAALVLAPGLIRPSEVQGQLAPGQLLPDLDQDLPGPLELQSAGGRYRLGFESSVRNHGAGPLILPASRSAPTG